MTGPVIGPPVGYDAFVAHAAADLPPARRLAERLVDAGLRVFLLEWEAPGVIEYAAKETALLASANGVLVFSRATMADPAMIDDYAALLWRVHHGGRRLIPVPIDDVELPPFAAIRKPVDLREVDDTEYDIRVATLARALRPPGSGPAAPGEQQRGRGRTELRLGYAVDVVGYSGRPTPAQEAIQRRLLGLFAEVLGDLGVEHGQADWQSTGDGMNVFLPATIELHRALPVLLHSWRDRLARDNQGSADRMRLRLSAAVGPVNLSALGFGGRTIIEVSRLLDSEPLRREITDNPDIDLAAIISDQLYAYVVGEGQPDLDAAQFRRQLVEVKQYRAAAWLWTG